MRDQPSSVYQIKFGSRAFHVNTKGMASIDAGGPYRDVIETVCKDLMSPYCPLFVPTANAKARLGDNRDCVVPNPSCHTPHHLAQYEFLGKLIGLSLRTRFCLNLNFPAVFWKPLVGAKITLEDVAAVDVLSGNTLKDVISENFTSPADFNEEMNDVRFTVVGADHHTYALCVGGEEKVLTFENRHEYAGLLRQFRLKEFSVQTAAVKKGLDSVVPLQALGLFTWSDVQFLVCGRGMTAKDVDLLQEMTLYKGGCSQDSPHLKWFWDILRTEFTDEQRGKYVSFVWGRSRLPLTAKDFDDKHKIQSENNTNAGVDKEFPLAHTCFFQLDLPAYSSREVYTYI